MSLAQTSDGVTFHPYLRTDTASRAYQGLVYGGSLVHVRSEDARDRSPTPRRAGPISDDKLTYTFTLRDDLVWSDGTPMTSADYKWTFDQAIKPENKYPYVSNLQEIDSYEAPDPKTIVVKLKEPIVVGIETADAVTPLPKHIWEKLDWSDPQKNPQILAPTVGSGPYLLKEWQKDSRAVFVANDKYYDGRPLIDTVTYRIVPSSEIAYQMLKTGEVDFSSLHAGELRRRQEAAERHGLRVVAGRRHRGCTSASTCGGAVSRTSRCDAPWPTPSTATPSPSTSC